MILYLVISVDPLILFRSERPSRVRALSVTDAEVPFLRRIFVLSSSILKVSQSDLLFHTQALNAVVSFADDERQLVEVAWLDVMILPR